MVPFERASERANVARTGPVEAKRHVHFKICSVSSLRNPAQYKMCVRVKGAPKQGIGIGTGALLLLLPQAEVSRSQKSKRRFLLRSTTYDEISYDESRKTSQNEPLLIIRTEALQTVFFLFPDQSGRIPRSTYVPSTRNDLVSAANKTLGRCPKFSSC